MSSDSIGFCLRSTQTRSIGRKNVDGLMLDQMEGSAYVAVSGPLIRLVN